MLMYTECSEGFFGQDCLEECLCQNGAECDFITGMCNCTIGFIGALCDMSEFDARSTTNSYYETLRMLNLFILHPL